MASTKLDSRPHSLPVGAAVAGDVDAAITGPRRAIAGDNETRLTFNRRAVRASLGHWPSIANFPPYSKTRLRPGRSQHDLQWTLLQGPSQVKSKFSSSR